MFSITAVFSNISTMNLWALPVILPWVKSFIKEKTIQQLSHISLKKNGSNFFGSEKVSQNCSGWTWKLDFIFIRRISGYCLLARWMYILRFRKTVNLNSYECLNSFQTCLLFLACQFWPISHDILPNLKKIFAWILDCFLFLPEFLKVSSRIFIGIRGTI